MNDLISRQAAIDAIQQHRKGVLGGYEHDGNLAFAYAAAHNHITEVIKHLPSAQSERQKGEWIVTSEFEDCRYAKCNQCKVTQVFYYNKPLTNYCPNCGAKMEIEHETN